MSASDWAAWAGVLVGVLGLVTTIIWNRRQDQRAETLQIKQRATDAKFAALELVARWETRMLGTASAYSDPIVANLEASAKEWRRDAGQHLAKIMQAAPATTGRSRPYRLVEEAVEALIKFEQSMLTIPKGTLDERGALDVDHRELLSEPLAELQKRMNSIIEELKFSPTEAFAVAEPATSPPASRPGAAGSP